MRICRVPETELIERGSPTPNTGMSHLLLLPLFTCCTLSCVTLAAGEDCVFAKHSSVAAPSCRGILDVQPDCYGNSGYFWIDRGDTKSNYYCDMDHEGGGWQRIFQHLPGSSSKCPQGWKDAWLSGGGTLYCQRGLTSQGYVPYHRWNEDGNVWYSEVRGFVLLRVKEENKPDGFSDDITATLDSEYMDGFAIEVVVPSLPPRNVFSYVIARPDYWYRCPKSGVSYVSQHPQALPPFNEYSFACDELDTAGLVDQDGYYTQVLLYPEQPSGCTMCPEGMPWFQVGFGEAVNKTLQFRFVDTRGADYGISVKKMEIYVR